MREALRDVFHGTLSAERLAGGHRRGGMRTAISI